ncbi:ribosome small subunit-dependent GTPase A [Brotaphodocola catenula]|uniref:Small ribosomal subunit biogenesis GTPase RsgA n=1 Tax=Brotaphodocola catenula TaxID=2885361 RepID=A0AAE3DIY0_9FIRM|nr:ribosome small subunit-dependent GTPase A [Brotaphodocola catenula]MCC2163804.1 ribosome small subunit-dependent GTPase A [Brotaphodocola catenula]
MTGKIIKGIAGFYYVHDGHETVYECRAKGIFRSRGIKPVVGDNVEFVVLDEEKAEGSIEEILPRKNVLVRPASANVDQALVVFAITQPEPNLNLLDRFLIMMEAQEVPVTICFNKTDLGEKDRQEEYRKTYEQAGYPVLFVSSREEVGVERIREVLRGKTTILAGPSGVGKSSLTNQILPKAVMETGSISEKIKRGKHTTRHAELFCLEENTYLCDTPGFSSMYLEDIESGALKYYFPEFEPFADACKFQADCVHIGEPVCGVKDALESGKLSESRYENYRILYQELKEKERKRY